MRLVRVHFQPRKMIVYHATWSDIKVRIMCLLGKHAYELVREYPRVGATEEMCLHCLKPRYTMVRIPVVAEKSA